ncbi:MAG TPA: DNA polymerase III subunit delta [Chloroflexota bacterium]|nr:DNA polymerase III subunit delta [Chloroflexota bacterium]
MPLLLYHGDNTIELEDALRAARKRFQPADVLTFDGTDLSLPALAEACLTAGLFDPERLVVVHDLQKYAKGARKDAAEQDIGAALSQLAPTTTLLLVSHELLGDHPLVQQTRSAGGQVEQFATPRKGDLAHWIVTRGARYGATVEWGAAELLAELVGSDPVLLDSELEKLATYAGEAEPVTPAMVDLLVGAVPQDSIFALVDAVAGGDRATALRLLHRQLEAASSGAIDVALYLVRMLARQLRILLRIRIAQTAGRPRGHIVADLKLNRYFADRYFAQARRLPQERLVAAFERLASFEHALKSGRADASTGLDLLVTELCG